MPRDLTTWSADRLAVELRQWAAARRACNARRRLQGKDELDADLLDEAARRLELQTTANAPLRP